MSRTIPIQIHPTAPPPAGQATGDTPPLTRREFLKGSAVLSGTLMAGSSLAGLAPSLSWAAEMSVFDERQAAFMLRLTQVIFPHKAMPEAINALAVKDLDAAASDPAALLAFTSGMKMLDEAAGGDWMAASPGTQLRMVTAHTDTELFRRVRGQCVTSLYDNELAYQHFGYPGEAWSGGGYITRGFNDLAWLPDPPVWASPTVSTGG